MVSEQSGLVELLSHTICKSLYIIPSLYGRNSEWFFYTSKIICCSCAQPKFCSHLFLLLGGHHTNILVLPLSICPSIQTRLKCKLDIWCCDVSDNTAATLPPPRTQTHECTCTYKESSTQNAELWAYSDGKRKKGRREGEMDRGMEKGRERKEFDWTLGGNDEAILFTLPGANTCTHVLVPSYTALGLNVASSQTVSGGWLIEGIRVCCGVELAYNRAVCIECCSTFTLMTSAKSLLSDIKNRMIVLKETTTQTNNSTQ